MSEIKIPTRNEIPQNDKWDLSQLFKSDAEWEAELEKIQPLSLEIEAFKGKLGESAENLLAAITKLSEMSQISELVGHYGFLLVTLAKVLIKKKRAATLWPLLLPMPA